jgi:hypothetical protein
MFAFVQGGEERWMMEAWHAGEFWIWIFDFWIPLWRLIDRLNGMNII